MSTLFTVEPWILCLLVPAQYFIFLGDNNDLGCFFVLFSLYLSLIQHQTLLLYCKSTQTHSYSTSQSHLLEEISSDLLAITAWGIVVMLGLCSTIILEIPFITVLWWALLSSSLIIFSFGLLPEFRWNTTSDSFLRKSARQEKLSILGTSDTSHFTFTLNWQFLSNRIPDWNYFTSEFGRLCSNAFSLPMLLLKGVIHYNYWFFVWTPFLFPLPHCKFYRLFLWTRCSEILPLGWVCLQSLFWYLMHSLNLDTHTFKIYKIILNY